MVIAVRWVLSVGLVILGFSFGATSNAGSRTPAVPCRTAQLRGSLVNFDAGAGQRYVQLRLTNVAKVRCSFGAYPSIALFAADGRSIPSQVVPSPPGSVTRLTLSPGRRASSVLHWIGIPLSDEPQTGPCETTPAHANVTPPGETTPLSIKWSLGPVCGHGELDARPLRAG